MHRILIPFSMLLLAYLDATGVPVSRTLWWMCVGCFAYGVVQGLIDRSIEMTAQQAFLQQGMGGAMSTPSAAPNRRGREGGAEDFSAIPGEELPPPSDDEMFPRPGNGA